MGNETHKLAACPGNCALEKCHHRHADSSIVIVACRKDDDRQLQSRANAFNYRPAVGRPIPASGGSSTSSRIARALVRTVTRSGESVDSGASARRCSAKRPVRVRVVNTGRGVLPQYAHHCGAPVLLPEPCSLLPAKTLLGYPIENIYTICLALTPLIKNVLILPVVSTTYLHTYTSTYTNIFTRTTNEGIWFF